MYNLILLKFYLQIELTGLMIEYLKNGKKHIKNYYILMLHNLFN
jgi:hypothetical protein